MSVIHEMYGIQAEKLEERCIAFQNTMKLLAELKAGVRGLDSFEFTADGGWQSVVPAKSPAKSPAKPEDKPLEHPRPE